MVKVSKEEAAAIRAVYPYAIFARTKHNRYVEERERVLRVIPENEEAKHVLRELAKWKREHGGTVEWL